MTVHSVQFALCALLTCAHALPAQQSPTNADDTSGAVISWLRESAIPLRHIEAGHEFDDLQPLKPILKDVRVVGLGEATHGTSEFQQVKHRLLRFLVTEMGFTAFALEAPYSDAQLVNDYVLDGKGDRASVLSGLWWVAWDTEEMSEMLDWMRAYNQTVPDEKKVRFHGFDPASNAVGRGEVLAYLRQVAPDKIPGTDSLFSVLATEEANRALPDTLVRARAMSALQDLEGYLTENHTRLVNRSSPMEFERTLQFVKVMKHALPLTGRTAAMGDILLYVIEHERPGTKFVVSAFDGYITPGRTNIGRRMRDLLGDQYYSVGTVFDRGSYYGRVIAPNQPAGDLQIATAPAAPIGTLSWYLSRAGIGNLFIDLRDAEASDPAVQEWLSAPQVRWMAGWAHREPRLSAPAIPAEQFDALIFIESNDTNPTDPKREEGRHKSREDVASRAGAFPWEAHRSQSGIDSTRCEESTVRRRSLRQRIVSDPV